MGCKLKSLPFGRAALKNKHIESLSGDDDTIKKLAHDFASILSEVGDYRVKDYADGYTNGINDLDQVTRYITMYNEEDGSGYASFEEFMKKSTVETRGEYIRQIERTIAQVVEESPNPHVFGEMDKMLDSGIALTALHNVLSRVRTTKEAGNAIPLVRAINKTINLWENPIVAFQHWVPGKEALERLATIKEYSSNQLIILNDSITSMLDKAETLNAFRKNRINRAQINRMLPALDGVDFNNPDDIRSLASTLVSKYSIHEDMLEDVLLGLGEIKKTWDIINYGTSDLSSRPIKDIVDSAGTGTIIGFYKELHNRVSQYYTFTKMNIGNTKALEEVKSILDQTDITKMTRKNYMPTYDKDVFGSIEELEENASRFFVPGMYRPKNQFGDLDESLDFEKLIASNLTTNNFLFNKMQMAIAREHLDFEYKKGLVDGLLDDEYRGNALRAARLVVKKLDMYLNYNPSQQSSGALLLKRMDAIGGSVIAGILGGPRNAFNNIIAGRLYTVVAGINVGSPSDYKKLQKEPPNEEARVLLSIVDEATSDYMSPGIVSQFNDMPKNALDMSHSFLRKAGDWLGDGGFMSAWSYWRDNLTVKGTEQSYLRPYVKNMVYAELSSRMKLTGLKPGTDAYVKAAKSIVPTIARDAWTDLSASLGHFDSINKPIWAHLMLETADNIPKVAAGMFLKYFYTFRQVMVTNVDLVLNRARQAFGGTFDERWDYSKNPNKPHQFHTGGIIHNPTFALGGVAALGLFSLVREFLKRDEPEGTVEQLTDFMARLHLPVADSANPIQGVDDLALYLAFVAGVANVDDETYKRYKASAINFGLGMAGGRFVASAIDQDKSYIEGLINIVSGEADWLNIFSDDIIETGAYGENLKAISKDIRSDTAMFRQPWTMDLVLTLLEGATLGGFFKEVSDRKQAHIHFQDLFRKQVSRWTGWAFWMDSWDLESSQSRKNYIYNGVTNKKLNGIKNKEFYSASRYIPRYSNVYNSYVKRYYIPWSPRPGSR